MPPEFFGDFGRMNSTYHDLPNVVFGEFRPRKQLEQALVELLDDRACKAHSRLGLEGGDAGLA